MRALRLALISLLLSLSTNARAADRSVEPVLSRIPHRAVESHGLATVGYSKRLHALEIEFHRGGTYRYLDVPPQVHRELLASASKAQYYNKNIRGKYRAVRVRQTHAALLKQ